MKVTVATVVNEVNYKGHVITRFYDAFMQEFAMIDKDDSVLYDSIADVKRKINNQALSYEPILNK